MPEDSYNFDVYRIKLEKAESFFSLQISNVISWDSIDIKMTKEELILLIDYLKNNS